MKNTILLLSFITSSLVFSQETEFKLTKDGFTDFVVTQKNEKTANEIYTKTLEWINKNYNNPEKVILAKVENDYIRIEGASNNIYILNTLGKENPTDVKYQLEIYFKDGKYKFDVTDLKYLAPPPTGWYDVPFAYFYKKDGQLKSMFKFTNQIPAYFNNLNKSLSDYISGVGIESKKDNW